jgi:hypothetical protein
MHQTVRHDNRRSPARSNDGVDDGAGDSRLPSAHFISKNHAVSLDSLRNPHQRRTLSLIETLFAGCHRAIMCDEATNLAGG